MKFRLGPDESNIVDWPEIFGNEANAALPTSTKINALKFLLRGYELLSIYAEQVHRAGTDPATGGTPSLMHAAGNTIRGNKLMTQQEWNEWVDMAAIGLCNSLMMFLGSVRASMAVSLGVQFGDEWREHLPMMVGEHDGLLMPRQIAMEIANYIEGLEALEFNELMGTVDMSEWGEVGGDECGDLLPGDENLPLAIRDDDDGDD